MKLRNLVFVTASVGLLAGMAACGGGGGGGSDPAPATSKSATGAITAFGSVYVNGTHYNTDNAEVYVEGSRASESDLRVGMVVTVNVSKSGTAAAIHYKDDLEGFVISSNIAADGTGTMVVMGQTVTVDADTIFESKVDTIATAADISKGNIVEVSGYSTGRGAITATRVEVKAESLAAGEEVEVKGVIANHDAIAGTFTIGTLEVLYDENTNLDDMPAGNWDGLYVEVKSVQDLNADGQLVASKVELENDGSRDNHGEEGDEVEVYGEVSGVTAGSVTVNDRVFLLDADTEYEHGSPTDLVKGAMVKVEGHVNSDGDLVAEKIEFKEHKDSMIDEIKGAVTIIGTTDTNVGTIEVKGQTILVNNDTIMYDEKGMTPNTRFNLADLKDGDYVEVKVVLNDDGTTYTAIKLEREDEPSGSNSVTAVVSGP